MTMEPLILTIDTILEDMEKFCHKRKYISAITFSPKEREIYNLRMLKNMSVNDIIDKLGVSKNRVWSLISSVKSKDARRKDLVNYIATKRKKATT